MWQKHSPDIHQILMWSEIKILSHQHTLYCMTNIVQIWWIKLTNWIANCRNCTADTANCTANTLNHKMFNAYEQEIQNMIGFYTTDRLFY